MMTLILVFVITLNALTVLLMIKLSELGGRLASIQNNLGIVSTKVDAVLAGQADPQLPADAEAAVIGIETAVADLNAKLPEPTPPVV